MKIAWKSAEKIFDKLKKTRKLNISYKKDSSIWKNHVDADGSADVEIWLKKANWNFEAPWSNTNEEYWIAHTLLHELLHIVLYDDNDKFRKIRSLCIDIRSNNGNKWLSRLGNDAFYENAYTWTKEENQWLEDAIELCTMFTLDPKYFYKHMENLVSDNKQATEYCKNNNLSKIDDKEKVKEIKNLVKEAIDWYISS